MVFGMSRSLISNGGMLGAVGHGGDGGGGAARSSGYSITTSSVSRCCSKEHRAAVIAVAEALIEKLALMGDEVYDQVTRRLSYTWGADFFRRIPAPPVMTIGMRECKA
jgi:hypothetical protein